LKGVLSAPMLGNICAGCDPYIIMLGNVVKEALKITDPTGAANNP
jgi:hypothetical protein